MKAAERLSNQAIESQKKRSCRFMGGGGSQWPADRRTGDAL
jgi:hypothetical protein